MMMMMMKKKKKKKKKTSIDSEKVVHSIVFLRIGRGAGHLNRRARTSPARRLTSATLYARPHHAR